MRRHWTVAATLLLVAVSVGCGGSAETRKQRSFAAANEYVTQNKLREAVIEYRNAIQIDPRFGEARKGLARTLAALGDRASALDEYVRAADLLPDDVDLQLAAGTMLLERGRATDALSRADAALQKQPNSVAAHLLRGNALAGLRDFEQALDAIDEAVRLDPSRGATYTQLGFVEFSRGRQTDAEKAFRRGVELDPKGVAGHLAFANFLWAAGRLPEAEDEFAGAVAADPKHALANRAMAAFLLATRQFDGAEKYLKQLADHKDPQSVLALADYYVMAGRMNDAIARLEPLTGDARVVTEVKLRLARAYSLGGQTAKAKSLIDGVLKENPKNAEALLQQAHLFLSQGRRDDALKSVKAAVDAAPQSISAQYALGRLYSARGDTAGAERAFHEVLRLNPRATAAQVELASLDLGAGRFSRSLQTAEEAVRAQPKNLDARLMFVRTLLASKDFTRAAREIDTLTTDFPKAAPVHVQAGILAASKGTPTAARTAFERALSLDPNSVEALAGLTAVDLLAKNFTAAKARVDARIKSQNPRPELLLLAARTYGSAGDLDGAEKLLRRAIETDPSLLPAYALLGQLYYSQRKIDQALKEFDTLSQRQSNPVPALTMMGVILQGEGNAKEARRRYEQAISIDPRAPVAGNNLAWMYLESGENLDRALQLAQLAAEALPDSPQVLDTLGWAYYKKDLLTSAVPPLVRSAEADPANPVTHYHLGLAYVKVGQADLGRRSLEKALALKPDFAGAQNAREVLDSLRSGATATQ
jgi:putative PEP-CTERM system TPR-repeat lipoprotein